MNDCLQWIRTTHLPCNKEDLALLAVLISGEIIVINCIATLVWRHAVSELDMSLLMAPKLFNHYSLACLINLEHNVSVVPLGLQLQEFQLAFINHTNPRCRVCLIMPSTKLSSSDSSSLRLSSDSELSSSDSSSLRLSSDSELSSSDSSSPRLFSDFEPSEGRHLSNLIDFNVEISAKPIGISLNSSQ
nr:hypothetical protein CARUB_v10002331mg [Ipomoea trifida]